MEVWKDIVGYEGLYQVSDKGNVRSLSWKHTGETKNLFLKPTKDGYRQVELAFTGKAKMFLVHRLVAQAFIPNPEELPQINHKDFCRANNSVDNLEWCTALYNVHYSAEHNKLTKGCPRNGKLKTLKINQLSLSGELIKVWDCSQTVFKETGMSSWSISQCCRGKRHTAYGYKWQYAIGNNE